MVYLCFMLIICCFDQGNVNLRILKRVFSILLAVLIIAQMMVNVGIGVYYHLNKDYIVKQLCINRNNPAIHCNGHCFLSKQLKRAEQNEKQSNQSFKEKDEFIANNNRSILPPYFPVYSKLSFVCYASHKPMAHSYSALTKPPAA